MALSLSPRLRLQLWSSPADPYRREQRQAAHLALDDLVAIDLQGPANARPVSTAANPGVRGRFYTVTDGPLAGTTYRDAGTEWRVLNGPRVQTLPHVWHLNGDVRVPVGTGVGYVLPFPVVAPAGQTARLVGVEHQLAGGTGAAWRILRRPADGSARVVVAGPVTTTAGPLSTRTAIAGGAALADRDLLELEVTAVNNSPQHLMVAPVVEYRS